MLSSVYYSFVRPLTRVIMTSKIKNTRITITGLATLKNRREQPDKADTYIFDALFSCAEATNDEEDAIGSFRHYMGKNTRLKPDGTYAIRAKVTLASCKLYLND